MTMSEKTGCGRCASLGSNHRYDRSALASEASSRNRIHRDLQTESLQSYSSVAERSGVKQSAAAVASGARTKDKARQRVAREVTDGLSPVVGGKFPSDLCPSTHLYVTARSLHTGGLGYKENSDNRGEGGVGRNMAPRPRVHSDTNVFKTQRT